MAKGTSSQTDSAVEVDGVSVVGVREGAAAGRDDGVAQGQQQAQNLALHRAEVRLAVPGEDVSDRHALARLDELVDVFGAPAEPRAQRVRHASSCPPP